MKRLARLFGIAGAIAGVLAASGAAKATTINIWGWTDSNAPTLLGFGPGPSFTLANPVEGNASFASITGTAIPSTLLDLSQTILVTLSNTIVAPVHIAIEVTGLTSPPFVSGPLTFVSGFSTSIVTAGLGVLEQTFLGSVTGANTLLSSAPFLGPLGASSVNAIANGTLGSTVFDEFTFSGGATGSAANVTISLSAVPGPIVGAGLPGLIVACGGLLALARRRRSKAAPV
jgi:hypothetical protein